jgi:hypothetical protein
MKISRNKLWLYFCIVLTVLTLLVSGCGNIGIGKPEDLTVPPEIPPVSSFIMDFGDFIPSIKTSSSPSSIKQVAQQVSYTQENGVLSSIGKYALGDRNHWGFAALNVRFWSSLLIAGLAIPVAAFVESFNHMPEQQSDDTWVWNFNVTVQGALYTAELYGRYVDKGVRWDMYVSKQNEYTQFHWYHGESNLPATKGYWILRNNPSDPTDLLRIDWHRNLKDVTHDIKYINIVPGGPENGGYIFYGVTTKTPFDSFYEIFNKGKDNRTNIEWNSITKEGRVKDSPHFGDNKWHCWNPDNRDIECP